MFSSLEDLVQCSKDGFNHCLLYFLMTCNWWPIKDVVTCIQNIDEILIELGTMAISPISFYPFDDFWQEVRLLEEFLLQLMIVSLPNESNNYWQFMCWADRIQLFNQFLWRRTIFGIEHPKAVFGNLVNVFLPLIVLVHESQNLGNSNPINDTNSMIIFKPFDEFYEFIGIDFINSIRIDRQI